MGVAGRFTDGSWPNTRIGRCWSPMITQGARRHAPPRPAPTPAKAASSPRPGQPPAAGCQNVPRRAENRSVELADVCRPTLRVFAPCRYNGLARTMPLMRLHPSFAYATCAPRLRWQPAWLAWCLQAYAKERPTVTSPILIGANNLPPR